jgi:hypothetical protein
VIGAAAILDEASQSVQQHRFTFCLPEGVAGPETLRLCSGQALHRESDHVHQPVLVVLSPPVTAVGQEGVVDQAAPTARGRWPARW